MGFAAIIFSIFFFTVLVLFAYVFNIDGIVTVIGIILFVAILVGAIAANGISSSPSVRDPYIHRNVRSIAGVSRPTRTINRNLRSTGRIYRPTHTISSNYSERQLRNVVEEEWERQSSRFKDPEDLV